MTSLAIDLGFKIIQIIVAAGFCSRFIKPSHKRMFIGLFVGLVTAVDLVSYFAGVYTLTSRALVTLAIQFGLILVFCRIPRTFGLLFYLIAQIVMFLFEIPIDFYLQRVFPQMQSLADVPPTWAAIINLVYFPAVPIAFIIATLLGNHLHPSDNTREFRYYIPLLLILWLELIFPMAYILVSGQATISALIISLGMLLGYIVVALSLIYMFRQIKQGAEAEATARRTQDALGFQISYYNQIHDHIVSIRKIRHDMKNEIQATLYLLEDGQADRAKKQLSELAQSINATGYDRFTGHAVVDAVISAKQSECKEKGVTLQVDGQIPEDIPISGVDLCSVFSNLLDNAIQASQGMNSGSVTMRVKYKHPRLLVSCENPVSRDVSSEKIETGLDAEHGWGLEILKSIAEKYSGGMDYSETDGTVTVLLWMNSEDEKNA